MADSLKQKTISGVIWSVLEKTASQLVGLVLQIVLARLLMPDDYGILAIALVFIALANVVVSSGFNMSLVQKEDADEKDFSTALYASLGMAVVLYVIIFFAATPLAEFYGYPDLELVIRVLGIGIVLSSLNSIQRAYVMREMLFKRFFFSTLIGKLGSGVAGIVCAYIGFGVWALVVQNILMTLLDSIVLWVTVSWRPTLDFSFGRFRRLFSFGWKVLASNLLYELFNQLRSLVIGKVYTSADLALYNRGQQFPTIISTNVDNALQSAVFSAMSKEQNDPARIKSMMKRVIKLGCYLIFPLMTWMAVAANPLVDCLLTDKWIECVPYLQVFCVSFAMQTIQSVNLQAIRAVGKSGTVLIQDVIKRIMDLGLLIISVQYGVFAIALFSLLSSAICTVINAVPNKKLFDYGIFEQVKDALSSLVIAVAMGISMYLISLTGISSWPLLFAETFIGFAVYIGISAATKNENFIYLKSELLNRF